MHTTAKARDSNIKLRRLIAFDFFDSTHPIHIVCVYWNFCAHAETCSSLYAFIWWRKWMFYHSCKQKSKDFVKYLGAVSSRFMFKVRYTNKTFTVHWWILRFLPLCVSCWYFLEKNIFFKTEIHYCCAYVRYICNVSDQRQFLMWYG